MEFQFPIVHLPVRSISLPSRLHPSSVKIESILNHLNNLSARLCSGSETIQYGLLGLAELYNCVEELMQSLPTQQSIPRYQGGSLVEEALEGSIILLDTCSTSRDMLATMKEQVQILQSALRRRSNGHSSIKTSIQAYMFFRKKAKRDITKCLAGLRRMEAKSATTSSPILDKDHNIQTIANILREVTSISITIFRSLSMFLSMPASKTKTGGWSLITKLVPLKLLSSEKGKRIVNEMGCVDMALHSIIDNLQKDEAKEEVQMAQNMLEALSVSIEGLEAALDSNFRCLIRNRVSFLNILAH